MIPWDLTINDRTHGTDTIGYGTADDRPAAISAAADAARVAILTTPTDAAGDPPRLTVTLDSDTVFILGMSIDELGKLDRDTALDHVDRFERDTLDELTRNESVGRDRAEPGE